ncbi:MAG: glycosyltransferase family 2 protein [Verrucomicrobiales bacterium]|nr:glycosyltransferase family 2 protein [Verrucomicrobiales bacterium]
MTQEKPLSGVSVIVPIYNEEENLQDLYNSLTDVLSTLDKEYEILLVNDGSSDDSGRVIDQLEKFHSPVRGIQLRRNFGQTAAMMAGIDHARYDILVPLDGDLQNDPADIPLLLNKLNEGYDVVSGWRKTRKDAYHRVLLSNVANWLISKISGVSLHDYGCSMKAYRRKALETVRLYGEMHRLIPIYAHWNGARVTEIPVRHHPRTRGVSKYGLSRIFKVMLDLLVVMFLHRYGQKPIYIFGGIGLLSLGSSFVIGLVAVWFKFFGGKSLIETPLPVLSGTAFVTGVMCILLGLSTEMLTRIWHESQNKTTYAIKTTNLHHSCAPLQDSREVAV